MRWVHGEHLLFEGRKMAKSTGNVVLLADLDEPWAGSARAAPRLPRTPLPPADEPHLGHPRRRRQDAQALARAGRRRGPASRAPRYHGGTRKPSWRPSTPISTPRRHARASRAGKGPGCGAGREVRDLRTPGPALRAGSRARRRQDHGQLRGAGGSARQPLPDGADALLEARAAARRNADWTAADRLRDQLAAMGVTVSDTPDGQAWTVRAR